jgi:hypothetical protein
VTGFSGLFSVTIRSLRSNIGIAEEPYDLSRISPHRPGP